MAGGVRFLDGGDSSPRRPLGPTEAERPELVVDDIGADPAMRALGPLLDLGEIRVDQLIALGGPARGKPTRLAEADISGDRVRRTAGEPGRLCQASGQVERF